MDTAKDLSTYATALAALGHDARLMVFRLLVRSGPDGLSVQQIMHHLDLPASTLAHHLRTLVQANLVLQRRLGRTILSSPNFDTMTATLDFLTTECCGGVAPAAPPSRGPSGAPLTSQVHP
jgi:DNA-binding transcriptional ArsR family regulator